MIKKILFCVLLLCSGVYIRGMDGDLDTTFNGTGFNNDEPAGFFAVAVAIQTDGQIVAVGVNADSESQVVRYNNSGIITGVVIATDPDIFPADILIQPDGKILIVGSDALGNFALIRYNNDGSLDTTFGTGGRVFGPSGFAEGVILQPDGKIVAAGGDGLGSFLVVRYNTDGSIDTIFQTGPSGFATDVAIQSDGKVIAGGISNFTEYQLVRYNTDGTIDGFYGTAGIATGPQGFLTGIVIQDDDKVVAGGQTIIFPVSFQVARFDTNGFLDTTYGMAASGVFVGPEGQPNDVVLQGDGKAVLLGGVGGNWELARYTIAGLLDGSFNIGAGPAGVFALGGAIQVDGKIIGVGVSPDFANWQIARYLSTPPLVPTTITSPTTGSTFPAGTIVLSGTAQNPSSVYIFVDGVWVQTAGVATGPGTSDTWTTTVTITTPGPHTIQAISIYEDGNVDIASNIITINIEAIEPPTNFRGVISCNAFLNVKECMLTMTWIASTSPNIVSYRIFRNGILIATVPATSPRTFTICAASSRCISCCANPAFQNITIVAVTGDGMQSEPVALELVCA